VNQLALHGGWTFLAAVEDRKGFQEMIQRKQGVQRKPGFERKRMA
jgi:hypothetical protein